MADSKQRAMRNKRQATRREIEGKKLGRHQARFERALAQQPSSAGVACLDLEEKLHKQIFVAGKVEPRNEKRLQKQPRDFERLEAEIRGRATRKLPAARNHDTATQNKARARGEPSPGPPASETDARPLGHQPRGGTPARPRLNCGRKAPAGKARIFSALQILRF